VLQLDGYESVAMVGSGGLGDVYRAVRTSTGGDVAIKVVREHGDRQATDRRVRRELEALLKLKGHPNVVQIEELINVPSGLALVMEFVNGGSLADHVAARGVLGAPQAVAAMADIARALADAHGIGIVHRDIKPHNVMIGQFGQCKVCDFGIAAVMKDSSFTDRTSALSYRYASPEELEDSATVGPPTDIFSLGVTLRQILTGETNEARYREAMIERQRNEPMPDLHRVALAQLDALTMAMTNREVSARPTAVQVLGSVRTLESRLGPSRVASLLVENDDTVPRRTAEPAPEIAAPEVAALPAAPEVAVPEVAALPAAPAPVEADPAAGQPAEVGVHDDATVVRPRAVPPKAQPVAEAPRPLPNPSDTPENWWETT